MRLEDERRAVASAARRLAAEGLVLGTSGPGARLRPRRLRPRGRRGVRGRLHRGSPRSRAGCGRGHSPPSTSCCRLSTASRRGPLTLSPGASFHPRGARTRYRAPFDSRGLIRLLRRPRRPGRRAGRGRRLPAQPAAGRRPGVIELRPNGHVVRARLRHAADERSRSRRGGGAAAARPRRRPRTRSRGALAGDPLIGPLVRANPGRRVPGHADPVSSRSAP